ncbi:uncharacterized protein LOC110725988 [Chenopodium quinoa]|uniref:uncharacterized protein LOC110725988 n=1 Tax=Chenopodium quinoa TaxID=63459 RepID=UPI000B782692|nr:uncharacterized protein LOC110725988 [Chenopodium quinoa]
MTNAVDDCVYHKFNGSKHVFLVLYVDDILLASNDIGYLHETKRFLSNHFEMKDPRDASFVLGIQIHRDRHLGTFVLSQKGYIKIFLKSFGMQDCKPGDTPVAKGDKFSLTQCPKNDFENKEMKKIPYASARTKDYMLTYRRSDQLEIVGYTDSDFAGCQDSLKSTSGYIFVIVKGVVS